MLDRRADRRPRKSVTVTDLERGSAATARATVRQRRRRLRARKGEVVLRITVPEGAVIEALLRSGALSEEQALRRALVEQAVAEILVDWAARWLADDRHA